MGKRVLYGQLEHETNSFSIVPTDIGSFRAMWYLKGADIPARLRGTNSEIGGFLDAGERHGWTMVPTLAALAYSSGPMRRDVWEEIAAAFTEPAERDGPFDGVLLALHGACITETAEDAEGVLLARLRAIVGPTVPIAVTLDLHANVSDRMAAVADMLCSYRTHPHTDIRETGHRAAALLHRAMAGEIRPRVVVARRPLLTGLCGGRTDRGPMLPVLAEAQASESRPGILDVSVNAGFPYGDVAHAGPTVTVTGEGDRADLQAVAEPIMDRVWQSRGEIVDRALSVDEAVALARGRACDGRPLVIADFSDNPGGGAYGDATNLLKAMLDDGLENAAFGALRDGPAATALHAAGQGATVTLDVGGRTDPRFGGPPLRLSGEVTAVTDGGFVCDGPMWTGVAQSLGPSAILRVGGVDILIGTNLMQVTDLQMFIANGIDPRRKATVALKSNQHFRAAFEPIAAAVLLADSGGLNTADYGTLPYHRLRRPIWPLDP